MYDDTKLPEQDVYDDTIATSSAATAPDDEIYELDGEAETPKTPTPAADVTESTDDLKKSGSFRKQKTKSEKQNSKHSLGKWFNKNKKAKQDAPTTSEADAGEEDENKSSGGSLKTTKAEGWSW